VIRNYADHSANERTFLAWVRTAIAVVGFGLAAARLGNLQTAIWSELALLLTGAIVILVAYARMRNLRRRIASEEERDDGAPRADALLILLTMALLAMLAMFAVHVR